MINKKVLSVTLAATLALSPMMAVGAEKAGEANPVAPIEEENVKGEYGLVEGKVTYINKGEKGNIALHISENEKDEMPLLVTHISEDVLIFDKKTQKTIKADTIKKGDSLGVFIKSNTPMTSSLPPQVSPQVIVLNNSEETLVEVDFFNSELVNKTNTLKLNVSDETILVDSKGEKVEKKELANRDLIVFYDVTTRSIPAQTNPIKVVALEREKADETEIKTLNKVFINHEEVKLKEEIYELDGDYMIPLREVVEKLGYEVGWNKKDHSI